MADESRSEMGADVLEEIDGIVDAHVSGLFGQLDERFEQIEQRLEELSLERRHDELEEQIEELKSEVGDLKGEIEQLQVLVLVAAVVLAILIFVAQP